MGELDLLDFGWALRLYWRLLTDLWHGGQLLSGLWLSLNWRLLGLRDLGRGCGLLESLDIQRFVPGLNEVGVRIWVWVHAGVRIWVWVNHGAHLMNQLRNLGLGFLVLPSLGPLWDVAIADLELLQRLIVVVLFLSDIIIISFSGIIHSMGLVFEQYAIAVANPDLIIHFWNKLLWHFLQANLGGVIDLIFDRRNPRILIDHLFYRDFLFDPARLHASFHDFFNLAFLVLSQIFTIPQRHILLD
jgi:hypothetical protein